MSDLTSRYQLGERVGKGGWGQVFRAEDLVLRRWVAVKLFTPGGSAISSARDHAQALARVSHRNIVPIYDVGWMLHPEEGEPWDAVIMEWLEGPRLDECYTGPLAEACADDICRGLLDGLEALHLAGLVHRDFHAENVMLHRGVPKILDILYRGTMAEQSAAARECALRADVKQLAVELSTLLVHSDRASVAASFRSATRDARSVSEVRDAFVRLTAHRNPSGTLGTRAETSPADLAESIRALTRSNARAIPMLPALRVLTGGRIPMVRRSLVRLIEHREPDAHSSVPESVPVADSELFTARFVVVGDGGDGKSTLLSWFADRLLDDPATVPLLLTVTDLSLEEPAPRRLTEALCRHIADRTQSTVDTRDLEALIESERFALVIDGVDEIHDRRRLKAIGRMIDDFARRYRHCRIAVACRPWVEAEQPFDQSEFVRIRLRPLDAERIGELVRAIAGRAETRGAMGLRPEEILQFILAHEDLKELAGSPLLCTLIALISVRSQRRSYFGRTRIYAQSLELLLYDWPRSSGRAEPSPEASRELFQRIAAHYHESKSDSISVDELIDVCTGFFGRDPTCVPRFEANKWWIWQREEIGLLQEDHLGRVRFFHRNFQDCLAADAILSRFARDPDGLVSAVEHEFRRGKQDMLCFLLTAAQAPGTLAERTFEHLLALCDDLAPRTEEEPRRWSLLVFLLEALSAAPAVGSATFDRAMDSLARASLEHCNSTRGDAGGIERCRQLVRRTAVPGHRLRGELHRWFESRLLGPDLDLRHGALWIRPYEMTLEAGLLGRARGDDLLAAACDLGGAHPFGRWARNNMTWEALRSWAATGPMELTLERCLEAVACRWDAAMFWLCGSLMLRMHWYGQITSSLTVSCGDDSGAECVPETVGWRNGDYAFRCHVFPSLAPLLRQEYGEMRAERHFELESNIEPRRRFRELWVTKNIDVLSGGSEKVRKYVEGFFSYDYCLVFGPDCAVWVPRVPSDPRELRHPSRDFSQQLAASIWARLYNQQRVSYALLCGEEIFSMEALWLESYDEPAEGSGVRPGWAAIVAANTAREVASASYRMVLEQLAEAHTGMLVAGRMAATDRAGKHLQSLYLTVHAQNLWLLHFLDAIAATMGDLRDRPLAQTMLILLVLAQYQTTWRLPEAAWWSNIIEHQPPHLLPRAFWCIARAASNGGSVEDIHRAISCLTEANLPDMVRLLCVPMHVPLNEDGKENVAE